jgi:hypothetical protein
MVAAIAQRIGAKPPPRPRVNRTALLALGCALIWLAGVGSMLAILLGHRARATIKLSDGRERGQRIATAASAGGVLGLACPLVFGLV